MRRCGGDAPEVAESMDEHRDSERVKQLIRKEPPTAPNKAHLDANPSKPTQPA